MKKINKILLLSIFFISYIIYLYWRIFYTLPFSFGFISIFFGILLLIAEIVGFIESILFYINIFDIPVYNIPNINNNEFIDVDVFIATYNEPLDLLYKTIICCKNMDYPDKNKIHIYICDDGNRKELYNLCKELNIDYITRTENTYAKAGNLNNALSKTNSPLILTLDADMIPMSDLLLKTVPFFIKYNKMGFVQLPQNFYNSDPFQYNLFLEKSIPNEQDLFFRLIEAGKSKFNAVIYAGSNTVISRQALNDIGGFVVGTITEDFATGMMLQNKGYKSIYLNEIHASGLCPEMLEDLYNQRIRWGRGVVQTFKKFNPFKLSNLNILQKLTYFSSLTYWFSGIWRMIYLISPILFSVFNITILNAPGWTIFAFWGPMFILTSITFKIFTNGSRTPLWSHIYDTIMFPQITKGVLIETFGFKMSNFKVTPKDNIIRNNFINKFHLVKLQIILAILSIIGIIKIFYYLIQSFSISYIINLGWLSYNLYILTIAILFASERPKFRKSERILIKTNTNIKINNKYINNIEGYTYDISETGISIIIDEINSLKYILSNITLNHEYKIILKNKDIRLLGKLIRINNNKLIFNITKINKRNYNRLLILLYNRVPDNQQVIKTKFNLINILKFRTKYKK